MTMLNAEELVQEITVTVRIEHLGRYVWRCCVVGLVLAVANWVAPFTIKVERNFFAWTENEDDD